MQDQPILVIGATGAPFVVGGDSEDVLLGQAGGFELALSRFVDDCLAKGCSLGSTQQQVLDAVSGIVDRTDGFWSFGKVRFAYGVAGKQPPVFSNVSAYQTATITDGWLSPNGLRTVYGGNEGVISQGTIGKSSTLDHIPFKASISTLIQPAFFSSRFKGPWSSHLIIGRSV